MRLNLAYLLLGISALGCSLRGGSLSEVKTNGGSCSIEAGTVPQFSDFQMVEGSTVYGNGFTVLEGPIWYNNSLYFSSINANKDLQFPSNLHRVNNGAVTLEIENYGGNGMAIAGNGKVVYGNHKLGGLSSGSFSDGFDLLIGTYEGKRFNSPNDVAVHSNGKLYFTDPEYQSFSSNKQDKENAFVLSQDGNKISRIDANLLPSKPNGIYLSGDESYLYIGGESGLVRFSLDKNGDVIKKDDSFKSDIRKIDGMSRDCAGNIYITSNYGSSSIHVLSIDGNPLTVIPVPLQDGEAGITNVAFGGSDGKTIYVTTMGSQPSIYAAQNNIPGQPY